MDPAGDGRRATPGAGVDAGPAGAPRGALDAAALLGAAYTPARAGDGGPEAEYDPDLLLIEWAPTGALGGWASDPWWPGFNPR